MRGHPLRVDLLAPQHTAHPKAGVELLRLSPMILGCAKLDKEVVVSCQILDGMKTQNHRTVKVGKAMKIIQSNHQPVPVTSLDHVPQCLLFLDTSGVSGCTTSLRSLFQCITALPKKKFPLHST